jgi:hypothetical protein
VVCKTVCLVFARLMLAMICSASLVQVNARGWSFGLSMNAPVAAPRSLTEVNEPRGRPGNVSDAWISGMGSCPCPSGHAEPGKHPR